MTDTNKERAEFEAWYASQADATDEPERTYELDEAGMTDLTKDCLWEGWQARAAKAPAAPTGWYALAADGMATLCVDRDDAEKTAAESEKEWPNCGPFRAVQLYTAPPAPTEQWTLAKDQLPPCRDDQLYIGVNSAGFAGVFNAVADIAGDVHCMYETAEEVIDVLSGLQQWRVFTYPAPPQGAAKGAT